MTIEGPRIVDRIGERIERVDDIIFIEIFFAHLTDGIAHTGFGQIAGPAGIVAGRGAGRGRRKQRDHGNAQGAENEHQHHDIDQHITRRAANSPMVP